MARVYKSKRAIKKHIRKQFVDSVGYEPNFDKPTTLNEKIQWLKLNYRDPLITKCSDKYSVREYVKEAVGEKYLIKLLGHFKSHKDIEFDKLPEKFVFKTSNGSGTNIVCNDKSSLDLTNTLKKLADWMKPESSHYFFSYEWGYKNVEPRIVCEEHIGEGKRDLKDYKFMCFNGKPEFLFVCNNRDSDLKLDYMSLDWERLPFSRHTYKRSAKIPNKPKMFDEMLDVARKLSKPFHLVRVDLYESRGEIKFGELTFYPSNGTEAYHPREWDTKLGEMLKLPEKNTNFIKDALYF